MFFDLDPYSFLVGCLFSMYVFMFMEGSFDKIRELIIKLRSKSSDEPSEASHK